MKNFWGLLTIVLVILVTVFFLICFQVRETESALVTRFGEPVRSITKPGLYLKWPVPIEKVNRFDSRSRLFEAVLAEIPTKGGEPIIVNSYVFWKIADPKTFLVSVGSTTEAEKFLLGLMGNARNSVIGQHYFSEFVNSDPSKVQFDTIENEIHQAIAADAREKYGIEIRMVGIKRLMISEKVTNKVFDRMKADRKRKTEAILAQGNAEAKKIRTDAESKKTELLAVADARAMKIRGDGDAEAAKYYEMLEVEPELAMFLRNIEALKKLLAERSTIVLDADTEPMNLLKSIPEIELKEDK